MYLIDKSGKRKRRACNRCHRVRVPFIGARKVCEDCHARRNEGAQILQALAAQYRERYGKTA
jgi:hypothetical protein